MHIAIITDGIWPYVLGGMQKHSYYLCKYLAQSKVHVDLYHFNSSAYDISKLEFFTENERRYISAYIVDMPASLPLPGHYIRNSYKHSKLVYHAIKNKLPLYDFIYTKGFTGWYLIEQKFKKEIDCAPIGVKFHGYEMFQTPPDFKTKLQHKFLLRKPVLEISKKADFVFSYGGKITEIIKELGIEEKKIIELPSGVEESTITNEIKPIGDTLKILFLGRYERRKGLEELNTAISKLFSEQTSIRVQFNFIGPIPKKKQLEHENVRYYGEVRSKEQLRELIMQNDILICPSWSEGMPNVILEAMANGLAIIATNVGATNVLVNDNTGWLIESSDPSEIKEVLMKVVSIDTINIEQKKKNARNLISEAFTWEKLIVRLNKKLAVLKN